MIHDDFINIPKDKVPIFNNTIYKDNKNFILCRNAYSNIITFSKLFIYRYWYKVLSASYKDKDYDEACFSVIYNKNHKYFIIITQEEYIQIRSLCILYPQYGSTIIYDIN